MSTDELEEIYFFGNLCTDPHTITFQATPEQQAEAGRILRERRGG